MKKKRRPPAWRAYGPYWQRADRELRAQMHGADFKVFLDALVDRAHEYWTEAGSPDLICPTCWKDPDDDPDGCADPWHQRACPTCGNVGEGEPYGTCPDSFHDVR